jgi:hypothetical protein
MDDSLILEELLTVLEQNGVSIRRDQMGGAGGGLCKISGKQTCFVDIDADSSQNAEICARAVEKVVDIENVYLRPAVREFIGGPSPR